MKRRDPKSIAEIIDGAVNEAGLSDEMAAQKACYLWPEIMGPGVNRYTYRRYVDHGVLHVYLTSAVLKNELSFHKSKIISLLNQSVGVDVITSLVFH
ncbi:MAG: DUF721 domain-containing protein [Muribaculaceae bacterium]|nr:DUF721 domain-containing protein [Muribaculaceae bacterium]